MDRLNVWMSKQVIIVLPVLSRSIQHNNAMYSVKWQLGESPVYTDAFSYGNATISFRCHFPSTRKRSARLRKPNS